MAKNMQEVKLVGGPYDGKCLIVQKNIKILQIPMPIPYAYRNYGVLRYIKSNEVEDGKLLFILEH